MFFLFVGNMCAGKLKPQDVIAKPTEVLDLVLRVVNTKQHLTSQDTEYIRPLCRNIVAR